jgi:hypothetical protein
MHPWPYLAPCRLGVLHTISQEPGIDRRAFWRGGTLVLAVFQGHSHKTDHKEINGIHYCTIAAMVEGSGEENNAFATIDIFTDGSIRVTGFYRQAGYQWGKE